MFVLLPTAAAAFFNPVGTYEVLEAPGNSVTLHKPLTDTQLAEQITIGESTRSFRSVVKRYNASWSYFTYSSGLVDDGATPVEVALTLPVGPIGTQTIGQLYGVTVTPAKRLPVLLGRLS